MSFLYGMHDAEGQIHVPTVGWCLDLVALNTAPQGKFYNTRLNWLVRLDWGYGGAGTIPGDEDKVAYLENLKRFVVGTTGVWGYIIGNEPNHSQEWPGGVSISVPTYCSYFLSVHDIIKGANPTARVSPAAIAPYQESSIPYWTKMLRTLETLYIVPDFLSLHTYTRGSNPGAINANLPMGAPLAQYQSGFLAYKDFLRAVPASFARIPAVISEFDEYVEWEDRNTGVVKAAYENINEHNLAKVLNPVLGLLLYRYPKYDQWFIEGKNGVIADFTEASQKGYRSPLGAFNGDSGVLLPFVINNAPTGQETGSVDQTPGLEFDPRALKRGVRVEEPQGAEWKAKVIHWLDEKESQGRHHIYFDTLDESGNRVSGVPIKVVWPDGSTVVKSEEKKGEPYSANFPMSPSRNDFSVSVADGGLSDVVSGIGMGADTPGGFNPGIHTSTSVIFQKVKAAVTPNKPLVGGTVPPQTQVPQLVHPIKDPSLRVISEGWGEDPDFYSHITDSGVPLKGHNGLDFAVPEGTLVRAAADGVAVEVGEMPTGYGKYIKLVHPWGETLYGHLSGQTIQQGMHVSAGETIGKSGSTGLSTGPHLHFGLRKNPYNRADGWGGYSDPTQYLTGLTPVPVDRNRVITAIKEAAKSQDIDWRLLASLIWAESSFRPEIDKGLGQIEAPTWKEWASRVGASDINDPEDNANVAAAYLKWLIGYYKGDFWKAVLAYNWGIGNLDSGASVPAEQRTYANKVIHGYDLLTALGV
jgi:hypothetical protein